MNIERILPQIPSPTPKPAQAGQKTTAAGIDPNSSADREEQRRYYPGRENSKEEHGTHPDSQQEGSAANQEHQGITIDIVA